MRVRTSLLGLCCSVAVLVAGCSATIPGVPKGPNGDGSSGTGIATATPAVTAGSSADEGDTGAGGDLGSSEADGENTGDGGSGQNAATCEALQNLWLGFTEIQMDSETLTQGQVDQLFQGADQAAPDVQPDIKTLHDAAEQAVGKSASETDAILNTDQVNNALVDLQMHNLTASQC